MTARSTKHAHRFDLTGKCRCGKRQMATAIPRGHRECAYCEGAGVVDKDGNVGGGFDCFACGGRGHLPLPLAMNLYAKGAEVRCDPHPSGHVATAYSDEPWKPTEDRIARAEANAAELVCRWNAYPALLAFAKRVAREHETRRVCDRDVALADFGSDARAILRSIACQKGGGA